MNHKRGRPKNRRAGCLMCKPHKMNGGKRSFALEPIKTGGGRMRREAASREDMRECAA